MYKSDVNESPKQQQQELKLRVSITCQSVGKITEGPKGLFFLQGTDGDMIPADLDPSIPHLSHAPIQLKSEGYAPFWTRRMYARDGHTQYVLIGESGGSVDAILLPGEMPAQIEDASEVAA